MSQDDPALVQAARRGDRRAFEALVQRHQERVFAQVWSILGNAEDARDAVQEAFLEGVRSLHRLEDPARFGAWVAGIARHVAFSLRDRRNRWSPLDADTAHPAEPGEGPLMHLIHTEEERARTDTARRVLSALAPELSEVLRLRYEQDLSYEEIAARLSVTRDTVRGRLSRAHRKVQEAMARERAKEIRS